MSGPSERWQHGRSGCLVASTATTGRPPEPRIRGSLGPLVRSIGMARTLLDAAQSTSWWPCTLVGRPCGRSPSTTVAVHLRRRSVPVRLGRLMIEQVAEIGALYEQGFTLAEIGARLGLGEDTSRQAVLDAGGKIRWPGRRAGFAARTGPSSATPCQYADRP